jgi:hypothetical protein
MVKVYAITLSLGVLSLIAWIILRALVTNLPSWPDRFDPETRYGITGRRVVAGITAFGLAGMSAEFSPRDISWPLALVLALLGAGAAVWYAGWSRGDEQTPDTQGS